MGINLVGPDVMEVFSAHFLVLTHYDPDLWAVRMKVHIYVFFLVQSLKISRLQPVTRNRE